MLIISLTFKSIKQAISTRPCRNSCFQKFSNGKVLKRHFSRIKSPNSFLAPACITLLLLPEQITTPLELKTTKFIILQFWRSGVRHRSHWTKIKVSARLPFFLKTRGEATSLPFPVSRGAYIPWLMALFPIFKTSNNGSFSHYISPSSLLLSLPLTTAEKDSHPLRTH